MRTIKTYESFFRKRPNEINLEEVKEAFVELCDNGYDVNICDINIDKPTYYLFLTKLEIKLNGKTFSADDMELLDIALSYIEEEFGLVATEAWYDYLSLPHISGYELYNILKGKIPDSMGFFSMKNVSILKILFKKMVK